MKFMTKALILFLASVSMPCSAGKFHLRTRKHQAVTTTSAESTLSSQATPMDYYAYDISPSTYESDEVIAKPTKNTGAHSPIYDKSILSTSSKKAPNHDDTAPNTGIEKPMDEKTKPTNIRTRPSIYDDATLSTTRKESPNNHYDTAPNTGVEKPMDEKTKPANIQTRSSIYDEATLSTTRKESPNNHDDTAPNTGVGKPIGDSSYEMKKHKQYHTRSHMYMPDP